MKASELIAQLQALTVEHGDLEVVTFPFGQEGVPKLKVEVPDWRDDEDYETLYETLVIAIH